MKNIHVLPTDKPSKMWFNLKGKLVLDTVNCLYEDIQCQNIYITSDEEIKEGDWLFSSKTNNIFKADSIEYLESHNMIEDFDKSFYINSKYSKKIILTTDQDLIKDGVQTIDDEFLEWFVKNPSYEEVEVIDFRDGFYINNETISFPFYKIIIPKEEILPEQIWNEEKMEGIKKLIQKQKLIDMMEQDEQLGLYEETECDCGLELDCKDCSQSLQVCTCIEDTIDMKQSTKDRILSETPELVKQKVRETANKLVESKQETLEEAAKRFYTTEDTKRDCNFIEGAKWQQERSYSEEEVRKAIQETITLMRYKATEFREHENTIIEQFKKK
jgi:hypothetical protein